MLENTMTAKLDFISKFLARKLICAYFVKAAADLKEIDDGDCEDADETARAQEIEEEECKHDEDEGGKFIFYFWCRPFYMSGIF